MTIDENGIFDINTKMIETISQNRCHKKYTIPQNILVTTDERFDVVGIDLGTSRCCAAVNKRHGIEVVALSNTGERLLPSYVAFDDRKAEIYGEEAIKRLWYLSKSTVFDVKRIIGRKFEDIKIDPSWPFEVVHDEKYEANNLNCDHVILNLLDHHNTFIKIETKENQQLKRPEEISASLLKNIQKIVQDFVGGTRYMVTITVPASFTDAQKDATCAAAILGGWKYVDLIPEPVAAAFAYLINQPITKNFTFLLFDLGGGTLNVCIFKCEGKQIEILCQGGNASLGGRDFDKILINYFTQKLYKEYNILNLENKKYKIMLECQKVKEHLSVHFEDSLDVSEYDLINEDFISITRQEFEALSVDLLIAIKTCINEVIQQSEFNHNQIEKVLLVGGGSRMPMIKVLLQNLFPKAEQCCAKHPDEVVAVGATYYAYYMKSILEPIEF
uniref:Heat shock protein 70 n=1 Tax=Panagrolaimus davidi TaxID=227884 RepID=A0A914PH64_9BILA